MILACSGVSFRKEEKIYYACNILGAMLTYYLVPEAKWKGADVKTHEE